MGPFLLGIPWAMALGEHGVAPKVIATILSLLFLGMAVAVVRIDAELRFHTFYAITDRRVLVLGWKWRHGRRTFRLDLTDLRYLPSVTVRATGAGTVRFTTDGWFRNNRGLADDPTPTFDRIADVRAVHAIFVAATEAARRRASGGEAIR